MAEQRVTYCSTEEGGREIRMWVVARGGKSKKAEGGREEAAVQCKNSMVVKGGRMATACVEGEEGGQYSKQ